MDQEMYDRISTIIQFNEEEAAAFKRLWLKYNQLKGAQLYNRPATINVYYDKPKEEQ